ncbi:MAG: polyphosphate kinase, partial [Planctomycetales bacterium]|nr:polyphosphate kinase [Planctomycetales bacterium]
MTDTPTHYLNRELSWLEFNQRVLDEARNESNALLERLKFLAITGSNLDEFFMVRVGGLQMLAETGSSKTDPTGLGPQQQLDAIRARTRQMVADQYACLAELEELLSDLGIRRLTSRTLSDSQRAVLERNHTDDIVSVHAPLAADIDAMPHLQGGTVYVCVRLRGSSGDSSADESEGGSRFAVIPLSTNLPRLLVLPSDKGHEYLTLEDAIAMLADRFFPRDQILDCAAFRITRNADMSVREDSAEDLMSGMREILLERHWSDCVRLEVAASASPEVRAFLSQALDVEAAKIYDIPGPLHLTAWMSLTSLHGYESAKAEPWPPQESPLLGSTEDPFQVLAQQSVLLCHPYESFEPVVRLLERAAVDPDVLAIKQTLYRTSKDSPIIKALARAAENGKNVTALVELKARFDEQRNIDWARRLESAGVHVIHGVKG